MTSTITLETSVSVVRELVIMSSSAAVVSGSDTTTTVVSDGDIDELLVAMVEVLVVVVLVDFVLILVVLMVVVLLLVVLLLVVLLIVVLAVVLVADVDEKVVVDELVEVITGEEVVDLFGTGINTATELSSIIAGLLLLLLLSASDDWLSSIALTAFSMAFANASLSNASGLLFVFSIGCVGWVGCGVVENGIPVKSSVENSGRLERSMPLVV